MIAGDIHPSATITAAGLILVSLGHVRVVEFH
jgi:hypothetical protein